MSKAPFPDMNMSASMRTWWDVISPLSTKIPMPKTILVAFEDFKEVESLFNETSSDSLTDKVIEKLHIAGDKIGYPLFLRTDQTSCKHQWETTCFVKKRENLIEHVQNLILESSALGLTGLPTYGIAFREFIDMEHKFRAFRGLPISREFRFFAEDGKVKCHHFYWVEDAIQFWGDLRDRKPKNWKKQLSTLTELSDADAKQLSGYARVLSKELTKHIGGAWSIDFCKGKDGTWYFIDCAPAEVSWHPEHEGV